MTYIRIFALVLSVILTAGCATVVRDQLPAVQKFSTSEEAFSVYVLNHGWHTGLVIRRSDIPDHLCPESEDFAKYEYLEIGWGDQGFYQAQKITLGITIRAIFWPSKSVLHVVGFNGSVEAYFETSDIVRVDLSEQGFNKICMFIHETFKREQVDLRASSIGPGLYGDSKFYRARGRYYFPKTCNVWTARALRKGGCPITPIYAVTSGNTLNQTKKFGVIVREFLESYKASGRKK